ncbi:Mobile element protein [Candidatus Enterovibrio escicola]|uniref:Mobile element protein n=1 Tax=Candidatus Enterovibrio escicola TaxID=1927127 RepID=A0A2A5T0P4_9GAMM|nr:Mobile element protein [Candidatus Enterovibrio escacola]
MFCYKQLLIPKLTLRNYNSQVSEVLAHVKTMSKVIKLGMPIYQQIN